MASDREINLYIRFVTCFPIVKNPARQIDIQDPSSRGAKPGRDAQMQFGHRGFPDDGF
jgi:hypothetical protein